MRLYTAIISTTVDACSQRGATQNLLDCNNGWVKSPDDVREWIKKSGRDGSEYSIISVDINEFDRLTVRHNPTLERK